MTDRPEYKGTMSGTIRRILRAAIVTSLVAPAAGVAAATNLSAGSTKCRITANPPTIGFASRLVGTVTVRCSSTALVTVEVTVVELDGTVEDPTVITGTKVLTQTLTKNESFTFSTTARTCVNTEPGNEEYATKARVSLSGLMSAFDRTMPRRDSFSC
ncbi:MAG: hypothetical protein ACKPDI_11575 [Actinomycetota bacterium]